MTRADETTDADPAGDRPDEPGARGCLLIAISYSDVATAVEPVVAHAAERILAAPMLGDFLELRFADGGDRPSADGPDCVAATLVADALTRPVHPADENYFALVVVDQSASAAAGLLEGCRSNPAIAALPLQCRAFAAVEDRPILPADGRDASPSVIVAPAGAWTERTLAAGLQRYAEELFRRFATTHQPGVTPAELAGIRERVGLIEPVAAAASEHRPLDLLPASSQRGQASWPVPAEETELPPERLPDPAGPPAPGAPAPAEASAAAAISVTARRAGLRQVAARWPWRSGLPGEQAGDRQPDAAEAPVTATAPVFLLLHGAAGPDGRLSWHDSRALAISVDREVSSSHPVAFRVRVLSGAADRAGSALREAGRLAERDVKRPDPDPDFGQSLSRLEKTVASDVSALRRMTLLVVRPVIIIFTVDVPVADVISAQAYERLAKLASIIWVVPEYSANLMSPVFSAGGPVLTFHDGTTGEIAGLLHAYAAPAVRSG